MLCGDPLQVSDGDVLGGGVRDAPRGRSGAAGSLAGTGLEEGQQVPVWDGAPTAAALLLNPAGFTKPRRLQGPP